MIFEYDISALTYLKNKDPKLGTIIDQVGKINRQLNTDPFNALVFSIIGQQISYKAHMTIYNRFVSLVTDVTPKIIAQTPIENLRNCGISEKKACYIKGVADAQLMGKIDFENLYTRTDEEIILQLCSVHGVGRWTAEMILMFSFNRLDVLSYGDLMIRNGLMKLHALETLNKKQFNVFKELYSPFGSIASFYLWDFINRPQSLKQK